MGDRLSSEYRGSDLGSSMATPSASGHSDYDFLLPEELAGNESSSTTTWPDEADYPLSNGSQTANDYIMDRVEVKAALIVAYTIVFCCCFAGNLLVIMSIMLHHRIRNITNFFLANLAVADLCVSLFCIYQNLNLYLSPSWVFGDFLCRMHHFVQYMSHTCSSMILTMIALERYLAIIHPIRSKRIITPTRLKRAIAVVWFCSAIYSSPRLFMYSAIVFPMSDGNQVTICHLLRQLYDSRLYDTFDFVVCFVLPLVVISVMYSLIANTLWRSGQYQWATTGGRKVSTGQEMDHRPVSSADGGQKMELTATYSMVNGQLHKSSVVCQHDSNSEEENGDQMPAEQQLPLPAQSVAAQRSTSVTTTTTVAGNLSRVMLTALNVSRFVRANDGHADRGRRRHRGDHRPPIGPAAAILRARRKVVRMLVAVVLSFTVCNLPFHARKMYQYWSPHYEGTSGSAILVTPITFLVMFLNSGMNPILYAFLSDNFRRSMRDVLTCHFRPRAVRCRSVTRSVTTSHVSITRGHHHQSPPPSQLLSRSGGGGVSRSVSPHVNGVAGSPLSAPADDCATGIAAAQNRS